MAVKSIFVPFHEEKSAKKANRAAADLVRKHKAHISVMHMVRRPVPPVNVYYPLVGSPADFTENVRKAEDELAAILKEVFEKVCDEKTIGLASPDQIGSGGRGITVWWSIAKGYNLNDYGPQGRKLRAHPRRHRGHIPC